MAWVFGRAFLLRCRLHPVESADEGVIADRDTRSGIGLSGQRSRGGGRERIESGAAEQGHRRRDIEERREGDPHPGPASACSRKAPQLISRASSPNRPTSWTPVGKPLPPTAPAA